MPKTTGASLRTDLAPRLRLAVVRLARRLRREAQGPLSGPLLSALARVVHRGPLTIGDLAAAEGMRPPSMTRIVAALGEAGVIVRGTDPDDRRVSWVRPTAAGRRLVDRSKGRMSAFLERRLHTMSPEEIETLDRACALLERLSEDEQ